MWRGQLDYNPTMPSREEVMKAHKKLARNLTPMQKNVVLHIMKGKNHQQAYYAAGGKNQNKYQANPVCPVNFFTKNQPRKEYAAQWHKAGK